MKLKGKSVLITGGTGALGSVLALRFAGEGAGVVVTYRSRFRKDTFPADPRMRIIPIQADVTSEKSVASLFRKAALRLRRIDILVNAAGGYLPAQDFSRTTLADWRGMFNLNVDSAFLCTREFLRQKGIRRYGRIFNISARAAREPLPRKVPYIVSKAAVESLTGSLAVELRGTGITVNAFAPSILRTKANARSMPGARKDDWVDPEDIAQHMVFLCTDRGAPVSGSIIPVYGGV